MNLMKNVKNKWAEYKVKKLEKEVIQRRKEIFWIPSQQDSSASADKCKESTAREHLITATKDKNKNKYRLREGNEREWIEKIKVLMEKQYKKPLEQQLTELMPLVRNHRDIKNAIKAKRIAVRRNLDGESVRKFLGKLSELYGKNRSKTLNKHGNRRIKCHKCKKRGHLRKNCLKNGIGN